MKAIRITKVIRATTLKILFGAVVTIALVNYLAPAHAQINRTSIPPFPSPSPTPLPADQIKTKYASTGGPTGFLGTTTSAISRTPDGVGYYQNYQSGSIYWTQATGVHETHGEIWRKYNTLGGPAALGYPSSDELDGPNGGRYSNFKKGAAVSSIYWKAAIGPRLIYGEIRNKYLVLGGPEKWGYPTTDEVSPPNNTAVRYNDFEGGSFNPKMTIYWKDGIGAHEVYGDLRVKYLSHGGPNGFLGVPTTDVSVTPDTVGRYNHFEAGSIYWSPRTGAHEVHGLIRAKWESLGWERSWLGYPLTDETPVYGFSSFGRYSKFQGGTVYYYPDSGAVEVMDLAGVVCDSPKLKPSLGARKVLAVLWDPGRPDHPAPAAATIDNLLFGPDPSVRDWYEENSGGRFKIERAGVLGWYPANKPADHYWNEDQTTDTDGDGWLHGHAEKWAEAIRKAEGNFNFAAYDTNGDKVLSGDELSILVVIPQNGAFGSVRGVAGREAPSWQPLTVDGVRISEVSEWYTGSPANLGAPAHELSHLMMGTPDLYQQNGNGTLWWPFASQAYSIMDASYTTTHFDPFIKLKSGWLNYTVAFGNGEYRLRDVETSGEALILFDPHRVTDPRRGPAEYFIIENRFRGVGFGAPSYDAGRSAAGGGLPGDGLAIWHIIENPALLKLSKPPVGDEGEWGRRGIRLVRADGGVSSGRTCSQVGRIVVCVPWPADDSKALLSNPGDFISGADARRNGQPSPARLQWIDGSPTGFSVGLISTPSGYARVGITIDR